MNDELSCAFTGHRPASYRFGYDEESPDCIKLKALMTTQISELIDNGVKTFLTGMALGADIWGAEIVLKFKKRCPDIKLIAALPCETQSDPWSVEQRERYFHILALCDEAVYISRRYTKGCMLRRNRWLVDNASFVIAVYKGSQKGGTAYTVQYAKEKKRALITINPDTFEVTPPINAAGRL